MVVGEKKLSPEEAENMHVLKRIAFSIDRR
jgi:hypothetical protein